MVALNPRTQRQVDFYKFEANLVYIWTLGQPGLHSETVWRFFFFCFPLFFQIFLKCRAGRRHIDGALKDDY